MTIVVIWRYINKTELNWISKAFSMLSHQKLFNYLDNLRQTTIVAALLVTLYLSAASGDPQDNEKDCIYKQPKEFRIISSSSSDLEK